MKMVRAERLLPAFLAGAALLAACGGQQSLLGGTGAAQTSVAAHKSARGPSWMEPGAASGELLYVSDNGGNVYVFSYPAGKLVGRLTDARSPSGLCTDKAGHVFVPDTNAEDVLEYKHGGTKPIATLNDFGYYPEGCAVDPTTGNLAVTNYVKPPSLGPGNVAIYPNEQAPATSYQDADFAAYLFCGYDTKGNLYVDGVNNGTTATEFAELPAGGSTLATVTLNQSIGFPGGVQWDGKYVALQDVTNDVLYRFKISGSTGTVTSKVQFSGQHSELLSQFWLQGSTIIVPDGSLYRQAHQVGFWAYPAGGAPTKRVRVNGSTELFGTTVSAPTK